MINNPNNNPAFNQNQYFLSIGFFMVAIGLLLFYVKPFSTLQEINVNGDQITKTDIQKAIDVQVGDRLFLVSTQMNSLDAKAINNDSRIKNISFRLDGDQLNVDVDEFVDPGYLIEGGKTYKLKADGSKSLFKENIPIGSTIYSGFKNDDDLKQAIDNFCQLPFAVRRDLSQIQFDPNKTNNKRVIFYMNDQNIVYANLYDFAKKFQYYPEIAANLDQPSVVDLQTSVFSRPIEDSDRKIEQVEPAPQPEPETQPDPETELEPELEPEP